MLKVWKKLSLTVGKILRSRIKKREQLRAGCWTETGTTKRVTDLPSETFCSRYIGEFFSKAKLGLNQREPETKEGLKIWPAVEKLELGEKTIYIIATIYGIGKKSVWWCGIWSSYSHQKVFFPFKNVCNCILCKRIYLCLPFFSCGCSAIMVKFSTASSESWLEVRTG